MSAWPFADLQLILGQVRLSLPNDQEIRELGELAEKEIVPPGREDWLPFLKDRPDDRDQRVRNVMQFHSSSLTWNHKLDQEGEP